MSKITVYASFDQLPASYDALFATAQAEAFYFGLPWYRNFVATVTSPSDHLRIYGVADDTGTPLAALPMWSHGKRGIGSRRLEALQNYYASLFAPALGAAGDRTSLDLIARQLMAEGEWGIVDVKPLAREGVLFANLLAALKNAGFVVQPYFCFGNWYLEVAGRSFDDYYAALPSQLKNTIKRKTKQFETQDGNRIDLIIEREGLDEAIAAYQTVYRASWKNAEPYPDFMPGLMRTCATQGWLRMGVAYVDHEPAAAQVWVVNDGVASIFKLAYDERFSKLSVGSILTTRLMRHAIDIDKVHTVDYLTGDDAYKHDWMSHRRERWGIMAFNPRSLSGLVAATKHVGGRVAKAWFNKVRGRAATDR